MAKGYVGSNTYKGFLGNVKMKKGYIGATKVYSAGEIVTYVIDTGNTKQEEIDEGASVLSPRTFTPSKTGWTFVGWRSDKTADSSVLTNKTMGDSPITLYAVFRQTVTISYSGNGNTGGSTAAQSGYRYYNNGNVINPSFVLRNCGFTKTGYVFDKWTSGGTTYSAGQTITASTNMTMTATYLDEEVETTWDKTKVYSWPVRERYSEYWHTWKANGLNTTDYTEEEIAEAVRCWVASGWIEHDGEHAADNTNCLKAYVDCSVYKGIILPLHVYLEPNESDLSCNMNLYLSGGGTELRIAHVSVHGAGLEFTDPITLNFTQTSGTTNVLLYNTFLEGGWNNMLRGWADVTGDPILIRR